MASAQNAQYQAAKEKYDQVSNEYTGSAGYQKSLEAAKNGTGIQDTANAKGREQAGAQNEFANKEAQKYANQQASAAAAGAQSQATTAARSAGMNKAQAAMMGSQQNANAYQNAYGNAYNSQMGMANQNAGQQSANYANQMNAQQSAMMNSGNAAVSAAGTAMGAGQQEGQNEYDRTWANWGAGLGLGSMLLPSDERLKHYKECSNKVVIKSPKAIEKLKYVKKEN